jgi:hypothetical protein
LATKVDSPASQKRSPRRREHIPRSLCFVNVIVLLYRGDCYHDPPRMTDSRKKSYRQD